MHHTKEKALYTSQTSYYEKQKYIQQRISLLRREIPLTFTRMYRKYIVINSLQGIMVF